MGAIVLCPLMQRLICLMVDSIGLLVIGNGNFSNSSAVRDQPPRPGRVHRRHHPLGPHIDLTMQKTFTFSGETRGNSSMTTPPERKNKTAPRLFHPLPADRASRNCQSPDC
jgi:hypothetical protein